MEPSAHASWGLCQFTLSTDQAQVDQLQKNVHRALAKVDADQRRLARSDSGLDSATAAQSKWLVSFVTISAVSALLLIATTTWVLLPPKRTRPGPDDLFWKWDMGARPAMHPRQDEVNALAAQTSGERGRRVLAKRVVRDQAQLDRLRKHMRGLKWCFGITVAAWLLAAIAGADPRYTPPFIVPLVVCTVWMLVTSSRIKKFEYPALFANFAELRPEGDQGSFED